MSDNESEASDTSIDIFNDSFEEKAAKADSGSDCSPDIFESEQSEIMAVDGCNSPKCSTAEFAGHPEPRSNANNEFLDNVLDSISPIPPNEDPCENSIFVEGYDRLLGPSTSARGGPISNLQNVLENAQNTSVASEMYSELRNMILPENNLPSTSKDTRGSRDCYNESEMRHRLDASLAQLQNPDLSDGRNWNNYMQLKKDKLRYQVNVVSRPSDLASLLFKGVSIFVNGYTVPTALELREMIQTHGGHYHCYYEYGKTTYTIASSLASVKVDKLRKKETYIKADWIVDSIAANRKLPIESYLLANEGKRPAPTIASFMKRDNQDNAESIGDETRALDARDPNFLQQFYSRSRLHLISELAQEMKDFMSGLRSDENLIMSGRDALKELPTGTSLAENVIFHVDLDCFFVSVALRTHPNLIGKPVAVTHSRGGTSAGGFSEIASCSYAARAQGCRNGMLIRDAIINCPGLVCLPYQFDEYKEVSKSIYRIMASFTKEIKAVSCDEMYANFTGTCKELNINDPREIAAVIREKIRETTGCPASVGIGPTVLIARLATRHAKPDGVHWVHQRQVISFIAKENVSNLPGVGRTIMAKLAESYGTMETCSDLQLIPEEDLAGLLGAKTAKHIFQMCRGEDDSVANFMESSTRKSVSCDINYGIRFTERDELHRFVLTICVELNRKLSTCKMFAASITLKLMIRSPDAPIETDKYLGHGRCDTTTKTTLLKKHTSDVQTLYNEVILLLDTIKPVISDLRGIGVQCGRLSPSLHSVGQLTSEDLNKFFRPRPQKRNVEASNIITINDQPQKKKPTTIRMLERKANYDLNNQKRLMNINKFIVACMDNGPSKENITKITQYLYNLFYRREYGSLEATRRYMDRLMDEQNKYHLWMVPVQYIWYKMEELRLKKHGVKESKTRKEKNKELEESAALSSR